MTEPLIRSSFTLDGVDIGVEWFEVNDAHSLPDVKWQQVYAIGNLKGLIPLVLYEDGHVNLPGGKVEQGEAVDEALHRELREELNCRVISWMPIGYQKLDEPNESRPVYQLRVYAELEKIGEFENDPGGSVIGYQLCDFDDLNDRINYGEIGGRMMELVSGRFNASN